MTEFQSTTALLYTLPQVGRIDWIGVRPSRDEPMESLECAEIDIDTGLMGDHYRGTTNRARQVTLIQQEHLPVIASCLHRESITPFEVRRNIVVSGLNLLALKNRSFRLGNVVLEYTGHCHPCSKMELRLGKGGFNAMRGHGGITARVIRSGEVNISDAVSAIRDARNQGELF